MKLHKTKWTRLSVVSQLHHCLSDNHCPILWKYYTKSWAPGTTQNPESCLFNKDISKEPRYLGPQETFPKFRPPTKDSARPSIQAPWLGVYCSQQTQPCNLQTLSQADWQKRPSVISEDKPVPERNHWEAPKRTGLSLKALIIPRVFRIPGSFLCPSDICRIQ